jgi:hypothetical protein
MTLLAKMASKVPHIPKLVLHISAKVLSTVIHVCTKHSLKQGWLSTTMLITLYFSDYQWIKTLINCV